MNMRKTLQKFLKQTRGMVGIEAAIVLIAFVIVAAAFSFMVVNMGLFSTQRGQETIQTGISEASSPLTLDGSIHIRSENDSVNGIVIPLKTLGIKYVPMDTPETEITLRVENHTAIADIYSGISDTDPLDQNFEDLWDEMNGTDAMLFIGNPDSDSSLDYNEKGFLVIYLGTNCTANEREHIFVEVRPEKGAPLSIEFIVPPQLTNGWLTIGS